LICLEHRRLGLADLAPAPVLQRINEREAVNTALVRLFDAFINDLLVRGLWVNLDNRFVNKLARAFDSLRVHLDQELEKFVRVLGTAYRMPAGQTIACPEDVLTCRARAISPPITIFFQAT
jgi:hypothetical protein